MYLMMTIIYGFGRKDRAIVRILYKLYLTNQVINLVEIGLDTPS